MYYTEEIKKIKPNHQGTTTIIRQCEEGYHRGSDETRAEIIETMTSENLVITGFTNRARTPPGMMLINVLK